MILGFERVSSAGINDSFWKAGSQISCPSFQGSWSCPTEILESDWERVLTLPLDSPLSYGSVFFRWCKGARISRFWPGE